MKQEAEERFARFVVGSGPRLLRLAWSLTGDGEEARDLVQTTLAKAYASWRRVEAAGDPDAYARRMLVNAATDGHRHRSRRPAERFGETAPDRPDRTDVAATVVSLDHVRRLLAQLPEKQRAVLVLRFYEDLSETETAAALGISVGTLKSHTARALARLRLVEQEAGSEDGHAQL